MKLQPRKVEVETKVNGTWVAIEEHLPFVEHERNARQAGATEIRTIDGGTHAFLNQSRRMYMVATIARYVLVEAESQEAARNPGLAALRELYDDPNREIVIHTIREATESEIELWDWHHKMVEAEKNR